MPHFISKDRLEVSSTLKDFEVIFCVENKPFKTSIYGVKDSSDTLNLVACFEREDKKSGTNYLYKFPKNARPLSNAYAKSLLLELSSLTKCLSHNLNFTTKHKLSPNTEEVYKDIDIVEIGFGSGRLFLELCKTHKDKNLLGFEVHTPSANQVKNALILHNITNATISLSDARNALQALPDSSLLKIYMHFPIPWNKAKHRRVISEAFLQTVFRILKPEGMLDIRSDDLTFIKDCMELVLDFPKVRFNLAKNATFDVTSKYEARWKAQNKDIYDLHIFNDASKDSSKESLSLGQVNFNFDDLESKLELKDLASLQGQKVLKEDYFVSFKGLYSDGSICLLEVVLGEFNSPFSTFLILKDSKLSYFKKPLSTRSLKLAHILLKDLLKTTLKEAT
ncbi:hypothetical protein [Helicobacter sp. 11S02629-2]|uniref:hypothetical protein n=1 Tax=Helicobacter sp. 11S02629-2 TaxID=1476195 RepID=UPI000BA6A5E7|nr:hypothetical protein [Helicobacter sp. 11S02629-2]PAF45650.1 hypothetical protein BKH40_01855 [Helicobacter sp. 11S02629-2]